MPRRRVAAALVAVALAAAACTQATSGHPGAGSGQPSAPSSSPSASASVPPAPAPSPIDFRDCTSAAQSIGLTGPAALHGKLQVECGRLEVPLDYTHPGDNHISLTVLRVHDTSGSSGPRPPMLFNPGGPGASGILIGASFAGEVPAAFFGKYDLVLFDPRGVGLSSPVHCFSNRQKDQILSQAPDATTPAGFAASKRLAQQEANACQHAVGSGLPYYNTVDTARDMDQIRRALGFSQTSYFGYSYGTELGWVYAHLFPKQVATMVLDGAVDPDASPIQQFTNQIAGFEKSFDQFSAYCRTTSPCNQLGNPRAAASQITARARQSPLPTGTARKLTAGYAYTGILEAMYSKSLWSQLATALLSARHGDGSGLLSLADRYNERFADGSYTNLMDANLVINCNDSPPGPTDAQVHQLAAQWAKRFPLFGRWQSGQLLSCQPWQPHRTPVPSPHAATRSKVLVLGNIHDPATPYRGAQDLTRDLGNAELLTWNGAGHTSYGEGSSCIDGYVDKFLISHKLPPERTVCPA